MNRTIVISINASWNVVNFRRGLIAAFKRQGWRVVALTPTDEYSPRLATLGVEHVPIAIDNQGLSPIRDLALLLRYYRLLRRIRPDVYLGYTPKPNVYGSIAAQALGIRVVNNISGLGSAFLGGGLLRRVVSQLYRVALRRSAVVFFQNPEDRDLFLELGLVRADQARLVAGSGIDLDRFAPGERPARANGEFVFLLIGRLLWQKGVREFVDAARLVRREAGKVRFQLLGFLDAPNRSAVPREEVSAWTTEGVVEYLGDTDDVRPAIMAADCLVLPSYREGLPRTLLEGAAMAKPLIATDVPGCRHVVEHAANGLLCRVGDARSLADAMLEMLRLDDAQRASMGAAGRAKVERDFSEDRIVQAYLDAVGG